MPEKLPEGWVKTTLGEIAKLSRDRLLPIEVPAMRYVGLEHIESKTMRLLGNGYAHEVRSSSVQFREGDVLYGKMRPYLNKVWVAEFEGICSAEFLVFSKQDGLNSHFLALRLNGEDFVSFANGQVSGERPRVDFEALSRFPIFLPPAAEQERIVAKLNATLARTERAQAATRRALDRLQRYRTAVLHAAVTGELTRPWRNTHKSDETGMQFLQRLLKGRRAQWEEVELQRLRDASNLSKDNKRKLRYPEPTVPNTTDLPALPRGWTWASLDQCFKVERGKFSVRPRNDPAYYDGQHPFVQIGNLPREGGLISKYSQTLNDKGLGVSKKFQRGTILIAIVGATIANTGVLGFDACCPDSLVAVQSDDEILRRFADAWLRANKIRLRASAVASGGQPNINLRILLPFAIALPPRNEQAEIARELGRRLVAADRLAVTLNRQLDRSMVTRQSLLREAFAGNLVLRNPNDEPASVLLERICAARKAEAKKPKGKRMSKSKSKPIRRHLLDVLREHKTPMTPEALFRESGFEAMFNESEEPQDVVDVFYKELRKLTDKPVKVSEQKDSKHQVMLKALP
jgi:type I restriction enzyme S subunit